MARRRLWDQVDGDLYAALGVAPNAEVDQIQAAWRAVAKATHPDLGGSAAQFQSAEIAYRVLSDPISRREYDRDRGFATATQARVTHHGYRPAGAAPAWQPAPRAHPGSMWPETPYADPYALPESRWSTWMVWLAVVAVVAGVVLLYLFFAVAVIVLLLGGAAAFLAGALRRGERRSASPDRP